MLMALQELFLSPLPDLIVLPFVAGVMPLPIHQYFSNSQLKMGYIPVSTFSDEEAANIASHFLASRGIDGETWRNDQRFSRLLSLLGRIPRGLEAVLVAYDEQLKKGIPFSNASPDPIFKLYQIRLGAVSHAFNSLPETARINLLADYFFETQIERDAAIHEKTTYADLETNG